MKCNHTRHVACISDLLLGLGVARLGHEAVIGMNVNSVLVPLSLRVQTPLVLFPHQFEIRRSRRRGHFVVIARALVRLGRRGAAQKRHVLHGHGCRRVSRF